jgi:hypothetical protein
MIAAGVLLFLDNSPVSHLQRLEALAGALIAVGFSKLFDSRGAGGLVWACLVMAAGVVLLLDNFGIWRVSWGMLWPLALVGVGISMLLHALERKNLPEKSPPSANSGTSTADTLRSATLAV